LLAQFENTTLGLFRVSCLIALRHLVSTVLILALLLLTALAATAVWQLIPLWVIGGCSLVAYVVNIFFRRILVRYGAKPYHPKGFRSTRAVIELQEEEMGEDE
ncbi:MAG: hypothetical protein IJ751_00920, partial [Oscillospiraceae bacterium]|nr:hypothetical protein [Oscillospiraceae bacterium]